MCWSGTRGGKATGPNAGSLECRIGSGFGLMAAVSDLARLRVGRWYDQSGSREQHRLEAPREPAGHTVLEY